MSQKLVCSLIRSNSIEILPIFFSSIFYLNFNDIRADTHDIDISFLFSQNFSRWRGGHIASPHYGLEMRDVRRPYVYRAYGFKNISCTYTMIRLDNKTYSLSRNHTQSLRRWRRDDDFQLLRNSWSFFSARTRIELN